MFAKLKLWISGFFATHPSSLLYMRLGPEGSNDNPLMLQFFTWDCLHKTLSWWKHFEEEIPHLAKLGVTQVWLPPPNKAAEKTGKGSRGYDAYDLWDLGEFNQKGSTRTRWGTRDELLQACKVAKEHGIDILIDAVLNHKLGADRIEIFRAVPVQEADRTKARGPARQIEGWTAFEFPGRGDQYSAMHWNHGHFTAVDWDQRTHKKEIYRIAEPGRRGWSRNVDTEHGNYDFLLGADIDHRHPEVQDDLLSWGKWILETTGASGFRLDAIKHIDRKFMVRWIQDIRRAIGGKSMFVVAEYWSGSYKSIYPYMQAFKGEAAFFDVPLHMNFNRASVQRSRFDLRKIFNDTIVQAKPNDSVTFVDNHEGIGRTLESWVDDNFKVQAYALILLRGRGHPCVFYGDIYPNKESYNDSMARNIIMLIEARKKFAYGPTVDYFAQPNCIGFVRKGDATHPGCAVILSNKDDGSSTHLHELRMNVGSENAGKTYQSLMTQHGRVKINEYGWGVFSCFANTVQVWTKSEEER
ncbi:alpha amylase [Pholiota conissans]|uniref:Alpha amylase n=1 Tax=Pholiota conissans TaxID=109636 RepID=A0A9P6CWM7_9AGAR|nr:alpha amylase [Pholiota conissans]